MNHRAVKERHRSNNSSMKQKKLWYLRFTRFSSPRGPRSVLWDITPLDSAAKANRPVCVISSNHLVTASVSLSPTFLSYFLFSSDQGFFFKQSDRQHGDIAVNWMSHVTLCTYQLFIIPNQIKIRTLIWWSTSKQFQMFSHLRSGQNNVGEKNKEEKYSTTWRSWKCAG